MTDVRLVISGDGVDPRESDPHPATIESRPEKMADFTLVIDGDDCMQRLGMSDVTLGIDDHGPATIQHG